MKICFGEGRLMLERGMILAAKLFFSIVRNSDKSLGECVLSSKTKTTVKNELRDRGLVPKMVFNWEDVTRIVADTFEHKEMTVEYRQFVVAHHGKWEKEWEAFCQS